MQQLESNRGMRPKIMKQTTKLYEEENPDSDGDGLDTEDEARFDEYFWEPSITSGSSFIAGTIVPTEEIYALRDQCGAEDTMVISFSRDMSGLMFGSFFLHSLIPKNSETVVAFSIFTSSKVPYVINPTCGFIEPGET